MPGVSTVATVCDREAAGCTPDVNVLGGHSVLDTPLDLSHLMDGHELAVSPITEFLRNPDTESPVF